MRRPNLVNFRLSQRCCLRDTVQSGRCETVFQNADRTLKTVTGSPETSTHIDCTASHKHCCGDLKFAGIGLYMCELL